MSGQYPRFCAYCGKGEITPLSSLALKSGLTRWRCERCGTIADIGKIMPVLPPLSVSGK